MENITEGSKDVDDFCSILRGNDAYADWVTSIFKNCFGQYEYGKEEDVCV